MTRIVKGKLTAVVLLLMAVTNGMAQMSQAFVNATGAARGHVEWPVPAGEYNTYRAAPLYCIPRTASTVTVGVLLRPGDYGKYYQKAATDGKAVDTPYLWVFDPTDTRTKFQAKVPADLAAFLPVFGIGFGCDQT